MTYEQNTPIIVTGGAGFIGSNFIIDWIREKKTPVINIDNLTYAGNLYNLADIEGSHLYEFIKADIGDSATIDDILSSRKPRAIINFAAESHVDRSIYGPEDFVNTNVLGTFRLLESVRKYFDTLDDEDKKLFRFLHVSTDEVYGTLHKNDPAFAETNQYKPNSPYAASKAASDHFVRAWFHTFGLPVLTTNCSNNYGPYQFPEKLIPLMIMNALSGDDLPIYGDGQQIRDWLYVKDHCDAIRIVLDKGRCGETYNIGGCNEKANIEIVHTICDLLDKIRPQSDGESYRKQIKFVADRPGHDRRYAIDARKIEGELGWRPKETFETGIAKTVKWYLENPDWLESVTSGEYKNWIEANYSKRAV